MGKLLKYVKQYTWQSIVCPILMVIEAVLDMLIPYYAIDLIDVGIANGDREFVVAVSLKMAVMAAVALVTGAIAAKLAADAGMGFGANLRTAMFSNIQDFSFADIDKFSTASLVTRMTTDVTQVQRMYMMLIRVFIRAPLRFLMSLILSIKISARVSSSMFVVLPIIFIGFSLFAPAAMRRFKHMFRQFDGLNAAVQENLIAIRTVKAFVRGDFEKEKFKKANDNLTDASIRAEGLVITAQPMMMFLLFGTVLTITYLCSKMVLNSQMEIGAFTTLVTYIIQILMSVVWMAMLMVQFIMCKAAANRIYEVLAAKPSITDADADETLTVEKGDIAFKNVNFQYESDSQKKVLENVSFSISAGETVGIIGGTGSAKTTLVSLIPRLYDVQSGEVLVGGHNVKAYTLYALRDAVSMVLQNNVLFSGTILENLRWGNPDATDAEIKAACEAAQADSFIEAFPDGYNTQLGQGGVNVSGGQKQRLCIARALLKQPKILILDDSTSAVDTFTDAKIREAFREKIPNTTKLIIAQRISSVEDADKIIVMDSGKISDIGTHEELLNRNQIYKDVYASQKKGVMEGGEA